MIKKIILLLTAALLVVSAGTAFAAEEDTDTVQPAETAASQENPEEDPSVPMGKVLPDVSYTTLQGETFDTAEILKEKKAVLINFFRLECPFCVEELPIIEELQETYGEQAAFLALDSNPLDMTEDIQDFVEQYEIRFPVAQETETTLSDAVPYEGYPCTIIIDKNGALVFYQDYMLSDLEELKKTFDTILAEDYESGYQRYHFSWDMQAGSDSDGEDQKDAVIENGYQIRVTDQNGDPVQDVMINFCSDAQGTCRMEATNADGEIFYDVPEDAYHITILRVPEGYSFEKNEELYTDSHYSTPIKLEISKD